MSSDYKVWTTRDGRSVPVSTMTDTHLLHTIRAIAEGRLFPQPLFPVGTGDARDGMDDGESLRSALQEVQRDRWLTVLKAEAIHRNLDWSKPPTTKMDLFQWATEYLVGMGLLQFPARAADQLRKAAGFPAPQVDVCNRSGKVTYLHWTAADYPRVPGTPVGGA